MLMLMVVVVVVAETTRGRQKSSFFFGFKNLDFSYAKDITRGPSLRNMDCSTIGAVRSSMISPFFD